jgi:hypothetical protein
MSKPAKPAPVRYYVDADLLGLAKILVQVRGDVTYPGDPGGLTRSRRVRRPCIITDPDTEDDVWIPETAHQGLLIITRDRHIQDHRAEIEAVRSSGARMINLAGEEAVNTFAQLEVLMCQWRYVTSQPAARERAVHLRTDEDGTPPDPALAALQKRPLRRVVRQASAQPAPSRRPILPELSALSALKLMQ